MSYETIAKYNAFYLHGVKKLREFRAAGHNNISTLDWYKAILDPEAYEYWLNWDFEPEEVGDEFYNSLPIEERIDFKARETKRCSIGLWKKVDKFEKLSSAAQTELKKDFPFAGYTQLVPGNHYFMLNYMKLEIIGSGIRLPDYYRRDSVCFSQMEILSRYPLEALENREGLATFKTRGSHHTTSIIANAMSNLITKKPHTHGIAMDIGKKIGEYGDKFLAYYESLPEWRKEYKLVDEKKVPLWNTRRGEQKFEFELMAWDERNSCVQPFSNKFMVLNHDSRSWEGKRLNQVDWDESGICQYDLDYTLTRVRPCLYNGANQIEGMLTLGGTSDMNNAQNNPFLRHIKDAPKSKELFIYFCGKQHVSGRDKSGFTDEIGVVEKENEYRNRLVASGDTGAYINYISQAPLDIDDCLYISTGAYLDIERILKRKQVLIEARNDPSHPEFHEEKVGWFKLGHDNNIFKPIFSPDALHGGWHIIEMPSHPGATVPGRPSYLYFAGSDNINKDLTDSEYDAIQANTSTLSKQCMIIFNTTTMAPVAYYLYRHKDPDMDHMQTLLGCMMYDCFIYPEANKENQIMFFKKYLAPGLPQGFFKRYLYRTPIQFGGNYKNVRSADNIKYGHHTGKNKIPHYENYVIPYFEDYTDKIMFPQILDVFARWDITVKRSPPDLGMAFMIGLAGLDDFKNNLAKYREQNKNGIFKKYELMKGLGKN